MTRLDAIKWRVEDATEGPWRVISDYIPGVIEVEGPTARNDYVAELSADKADLEFIAHARTDVPALVAAVEAVLALHPEEIRGDGLRYCGGCTDGLIERFPCDEVVAIRDALGETE